MIHSPTVCQILAQKARDSGIYKALSNPEWVCYENQLFWCSSLNWYMCCYITFLNSVHPPPQKKHYFLGGVIFQTVLRQKKIKIITHNSMFCQISPGNKGTSKNIVQPPNAVSIHYCCSYHGCLAIATVRLISSGVRSGQWNLSDHID